MSQNRTEWAEASISGFVVRALLGRLRSEGFDIDLLLKDAHINAAQVDTPDQSVPLKNYVRLFEIAANTSRTPHLGLRLSQEMGPDSLGIIGYLFLSAPTLKDALERTRAYIGTIQTGVENKVVATDKSVFWSYRILDPSIRSRRQDSEYSIGLILKLIRTLAGSRYVPDEIHFEHAKVGSLDRYTSVFGAPVYFEQPANAILISGDVLTQPRHAIDPRLFPVLQHQLKARIETTASRANTVDQVKGYLESLSAPAATSQKTVAQVLGLSEATLRRHLRRRSTNFKAIADQVCFSLSARHLEASDMTITEIAHLLGYAETACFIRAFQRWANKTPAAYRRAYFLSQRP